MTPQADLLITGSHLLPGARQSELREDHGLAVAGDTIIAIGPTADLEAAHPRAQRLHTAHGLIMPGLINTHTHAAMSCFRGIADDLPLMTWLQDYIFPLERRLTPEIVYHSTLLSLAEMIRSGTTSFCDMYLFADDVARAAEQSGLRAWIGEVLYDFPSPSYGPVEAGFTCIEEMFSRYRHHPLVRVAVMPHSVYTCSPELLQRLAGVAHRENAILHLHLSENDAEVATCRERYGVTPTQHLDRLGVLDATTLAAHCVVLDDDDIDLLAARRVKVSHCVESNLKLASGIAPVVRMMDRGITVSLGTDGSASNNNVDMFGEMNCVAKVHKVDRMDPTAMSAETTLAAATIGGARAFGMEERIGSLVVGKKADVIVIDLDQPHLIPLYNVPSHLVYAARGGDVVHSIINGRIVMRDRQLLTIDEQEILAAMREIAAGFRPLPRRS
jgi:5-methylthioadenosine/S-adenosylhomocysteine deaminase